MGNSVLRAALSLLAIVPSVIFFIALPAFFELTDFSVLQVVFMALAGLLSILAIHLSTYKNHIQALRADGSFKLLNPRANPDAKQNMPSLGFQRDTVSALIAQVFNYKETKGRSEPIPVDVALGQIVLRILNAWHKMNAAEATDIEIRELYLFCQVMKAEPQEAGPMLNLFLKPGKLLDIRDQLDTIRSARDRYETQRDTFEATRAVWQMRSGKSDARLLDTMQRMAMPDPDLWHYIVTGHDTNKANQVEAATWCLQQPMCDKATIAAYFCRVVRLGLLKAAIEEKDDDYINMLLDVISRWNGAWYTNSELEWDFGDSAEDLETELSADLARVAEVTSSPPISDPVLMFRDYTGRKVRRRDNWSLVEGTLTSPPKIEDYVDSKDSAA